MAQSLGRFIALTSACQHERIAEDPGERGRPQRGRSGHLRDSPPEPDGRSGAHKRDDDDP